MRSENSSTFKKLQPKAGTLTIVVKKAILTYSTGGSFWDKKMDPFASLQVSWDRQLHNTRVAEDMDRHPLWESESSTFKFEFDPATKSDSQDSMKLLIKVMDKNTIGSTLIGKGDLDLDNILSGIGGSKSHPFTIDIFRKGKERVQRRYGW